MTPVLKSQVFTYDSDITRFVKSFNDAAMQVVLKIRVAKHKMHAPRLSIVDGGLLINENVVSSCWKFQFPTKLYTLLNFNPHGWFEKLLPTAAPLNTRGRTSV